MKQNQKRRNKRERLKKQKKQGKNVELKNDRTKQTNK